MLDFQKLRNGETIDQEIPGIKTSKDNPETANVFLLKYFDIPFEINSFWPFLTLTQSREY